MKIEVGESLIGSWLKHICRCQIVQQNWKTSDFWDICVSEKEIQKTLQGLKKHFKQNEIEFISKKQKSSQMIKQGEVDCIGLNLELDNDSNLLVRNICAVDVAFHEAGLNYGNIDNTCARITKKYIRTALTIYQYFGIKRAEIIFATPKTTSLIHSDKLKETAININNVFNELGFSFQFKLYCNEDFNTIILNPLINDINKISDSSDLFIRSIKLSNIFNSSNKLINDETIVNILQTDNKFEAIKPKIAVLARNIFNLFSKENKLNEIEVNNLCDVNYSKREFNISMNLPILKKYNSKEDAFINESRRYYAEIYKFNNKKYLLCNHWLENQYDLLENWAKKLDNK